MAAPPPLPLGLQQLLPLGMVRVKGRRSIFTHKYLVTNDGGDKIFTVREYTSGLAFLVKRKERPFNMRFFDGNEQNVVSLRRPYCFGSLNKMKVSVCGVVASVVRQEPTCFKPVLSINDPNDTQVLRIKGFQSFGPNVKYELLTRDKTPIGTIHRKWKWMEPDQYTITFPVDLDVRYKVAVIGSCILIDYLYHR